MEKELEKELIKRREEFLKALEDVFNLDDEE